MTAPALVLAETPLLVDGFGRRIDYVRLSLTDRCDLRCTYCMPQKMRFVPRSEVLSLEEIAELAGIFVARGVRKLRLTGGEPLVRRGVVDLAQTIGGLLGAGLEELTMTTNGTQLARHAEGLAAAGIRRINVSLDTRDPARFRELTRGGDLAQVLDGIAAARAAGMAVKINMVALAGINQGEIAAMLCWCMGEGHDLTLIEAMPLGDVGFDRAAHHLSLGPVREALVAEFGLAASTHRSGGPARYWEVPGGGTRVGFITPLSGNFCEGCNRIRLTATGRLYGCLGQSEKVELRDAFREGGRAAVAALLDRLVAAKPKGHEFHPSAAVPATARHMSATGG